MFLKLGKWASFLQGGRRLVFLKLSTLSPRVQQGGGGETGLYLVFSKLGTLSPRFLQEREAKGEEKTLGEEEGDAKCHCVASTR